MSATIDTHTLICGVPTAQRGQLTGYVASIMQHTYVLICSYARIGPPPRARVMLIGPQASYPHKFHLKSLHRGWNGVFSREDNRVGCACTEDAHCGLVTAGWLHSCPVELKSGAGFFALAGAYYVHILLDSRHPWRYLPRVLGLETQAGATRNSLWHGHCPFFLQMMCLPCRITK